MRKIAWFDLLLVFSLALVFRVWITSTYIGFNQHNLTSDDYEFEAIARTLAQRGQYAVTLDGPPTAHRSPLLPVLVAGVYVLAGPKQVAAQGVLMVISAATAVLTVLLGREVAGRWVGWAAGLLVAVDPFAWIFAGIFYSETLFAFLFTLVLLMLLRVVKQPGRLNLVILGVGLGCVVLTRPNGLGVVLVSVALLPLAGGKPLSIWLKRAGLVLVIALLLLVPWVGRNYIVFQRFVPTTSQMGEVMLGVYNDTCLYYRCNEWVAVSVLPEGKLLTETEEMARNDEQFIMALASIRAQPYMWIRIMPTKVIRFWIHDTILPNTPYQVNPPPAFLNYQRIFYRFLLVLGLTGLILLYWRGHRRAFIIFTTFVAVFSFMTLLLWGDARIRMPLHPLLAVPAAYTIIMIYLMTKRIMMRQRNIKIEV